MKVLWPRAGSSLPFVIRTTPQKLLSLVMRHWMGSLKTVLERWSQLPTPLSQGRSWITGVYSNLSWNHPPSWPTSSDHMFISVRCIFHSQQHWTMHSKSCLESKWMGCPSSISHCVCALRYGSPFWPWIAWIFIQTWCHSHVNSGHPQIAQTWLSRWAESVPIHWQDCREANPLFHQLEHHTLSGPS